MNSILSHTSSSFTQGRFIRLRDSPLLKRDLLQDPLLIADGLGVRGPPRGDHRGGRVLASDERGDATDLVSPAVTSYNAKLSVDFKMSRQ